MGLTAIMWQQRLKQNISKPELEKIIRENLIDGKSSKELDLLLLRDDIKKLQEQLT
jgi:hypothetical protein